MFDTDQFLTASVEGEMATERVTVPEADYQGYIKTIKVRSGESKNDGETFYMLDLFWNIEDGALSELTGKDINSVRQSFFLDMDELGNLELGKGKNVDLGKLREALGQNDGSAWSPSMLTGASALIHVENRMYEGKLFADVTRVSAV